MQFADILRTASGNLGRRKVRTALTTIGIIVGITTIVSMLSLGVGIQREVRRQFETVGLENVFVAPQNESGSFTQFTRPERSLPIHDDDLERWRQIPGVAEVIPELTVDRSIITVLRIGEREQQVRIENAELIAEPFERPPEALAGSMQPQAPDEIVLDRGALRERDLTPEGLQQLIGQQIQIVLETPRGEQQSFTFKVAGVISKAEARAAVRLPLAARAAIKSWWFNTPDIIAEDGYDSATIRGEDVNAARRVVSQLRAEGYEVRSLEGILEVASNVFTLLNLMLGSVGGLALLVASIGIVNTMIMAIYERTREIGTLKAIGASRGDIRKLFMFEAGMIGLLGGLIGTLLGWLIGLGLNELALWYLESEQIPLRGTFFVLPLWLVGMALGFATLIGVLAGLYPANRAAKLDPLLALRHD